VTLFGSKEVSKVFRSFAKYNWERDQIMKRSVANKLEELINTSDMKFLQTGH